MIEYDTRFNPIIEPTGRECLTNEEKLRPFLLPSNCCLASFINTADKSECNAMFRTLLPVGFTSNRGFQSLDEFLGVIKKPVLSVEVTR
jgi:hypothetical protein